jgi:hypothetical protein
VPVSRLRFLLEALPQEGFGHVDFIAWPGARANILFQFSTSPWAHYRTAYHFAELMKYILSMMGDKSCLSTLSGLGVTALGMAAQHGSSIICRILLEARIDPNAGVSRTPLNSALEWLEKCFKREQKSWGTTEPGEKRLAFKLRQEAEETVRLLRLYGAVNEMRPFDVYSALANGQYQMGSPEVSFFFLPVPAN